MRQQVNEYFKDDPIMVRVAWCESRFRQFEKDGSLFRGKINSNDIGVMQINTYYHEKTAARMNLDLTTTEGNMAYAKYLYDREGTTPWNSSSACWKRSDAEVAFK